MSSLWHRVTEKARSNPNLSAAQFPQDTFYNTSARAGDEMWEQAEQVEQEIFGAQARPKGTRVPEAEGLRYMGQTLETWAHDSEMSPILGSGYRGRFN